MIVYSRVSVQPASEPVTLEDMKAFLKVDGSDDDALITSLISVARISCEIYAGLSFITQTRVVKMDSFNCKDVILPYGPVQSVTSIAYVDENDAPQTINTGYTLDTQSGLCKLRVTEDWPITNRVLNNVVITYVAGEASANELVKHAIKMQAASLYENRQDEIIGNTANILNWNSASILDTIKVYWNAEI